MMKNGEQLSTEPRPGLVFNNPKAYPNNTGQRFVLRIEAHTDGEPGMFHTPADLMQWLSTHPYINSVKLLEIGEERHNVKKPPFNVSKAKPSSKKSGNGDV